MLRLLSNPLSGIVLALVAGGALSFAYAQGRSHAAGSYAKKLVRMGDNYVTLFANEKVAHWNQIGQERRAHREQMEFVDRLIDASDGARRKNAAQRQAYLNAAREAEARATRLLNQMEQERNDFANERAPNDWVCAVYDGVHDIPGCRNGEFTRPATRSEDSDGVLRPEGAPAIDAGEATPDMPGASDQSNK